MSNRVRELLEEFATKLEAEMKREMMSTIGATDLGLGGSSSAKGSTTKGSARGRGKGVKRDAGALEALAEKFVGFVKSHPNLRVEQINKELGTTTKDLQLPIRKLLADRRIKASGQKRATTYVVAGGSAKAKGGKKAKRSKAS